MSAADETFTLPVLPIKNTVLYPHLLMPLAVARSFSQAAVEAAVDGEDKSLVIVAQRNASVEEPTFDDLYKVGTVAVIKRMERSEAGVQIIVQGARRVELIEAQQVGG